MVGQRAGRRRRRLRGLPALLATLLAVVFGVALVAPSNEPRPGASAALGSAVVPPLAAVTKGHVDVRLPGKRSGRWTTGPVLAAARVSAFRLVVPVGWRAGVGVVAAGVWLVGGKAYRGRAPPAA